MDRAGTDDDEKATLGVEILNYTFSFVAGGKNSGLGLCGLKDFVLKEIGRGERVVASD